MDKGYDVYCGLDVGKSEHHAVALNAAGESDLYPGKSKTDAR